jgi:hypothetical protein
MFAWVVISRLLQSIASRHLDDPSSLLDSNDTSFYQMAPHASYTPSDARGSVIDPFKVSWTHGSLVDADEGICHYSLVWIASVPQATRTHERADQCCRERGNPSDL